jgi:adenylosuccinate lyase
MTSRDLTENIELIAIRDGLNLIRRRTLETLFLLEKNITKYEKTYITGRSHNVPAQVTTLGKRFASCAEELLFALQGLDELINRLPLRGIKGPVGSSQDGIVTLGSIKKLKKLEEALEKEFNFKNTLTSTGQIYPRSFDFEVVSKLLQIVSAPSSMSTTIRLMAGSNLASEGFKIGQVGSSAMPHKMNSRSSERINGMMVLLRGYSTMAADLAGNQWNEGDVSCSVVRRVVIPDSFFVVDGLLHTFMTILTEFGIFEQNIKNELQEQLPFLATSQILIECVKAGMGREAAHKLIKKYSTTDSVSNLFSLLCSDTDFPLSLSQLSEIVNNLESLSGNSINQSRIISTKIRKIVGNIGEINLENLI